MRQNRSEAAKYQEGKISVTDKDVDLAEVLAQFTNLIMNERVRAYNEGVDTERERCARLAEHCFVAYACIGAVEDELKQIDLARRDIAGHIRQNELSG